MPKILFVANQNVTSDDVAKVAAFADFVGKHCYDVFRGSDLRWQSERLASLVCQVAASLDPGDRPHFSTEATQAVLDFRNLVGGDCFDVFGGRGHKGKSMKLLRLSWDVDKILDQLVVYHLSPEEQEAADMEAAYELSMYEPEAAT